MLSRLTIQNYVLIKHLEMEPSRGLSIITGETGAGKSIMLGAVGLLLGKRADTKALLSHDKKCIVEGIFDIKGYGLRSLFDDLDLDYEEQTIIRREISPSGKSRAFVNDTPVLLESLRQIGERLLDVHSQHDTFDLGEQNYQLRLLDAYSGNQELINNYTDTYFRFRKAFKTFKELTDRSAELRRDQDYNQFLFDELETLGLEADEQERLEEEQSILEHAEEIKSQLSQASQVLSDPEHGVMNLLGAVREALSRISEYGHTLKELSERLESNVIDLNDLRAEIEAEDEHVEYDPRKAREIGDRLSEIYRLQQKHQVNNIQELLVIHTELGEKLHVANNLDEELEKAEKNLEALRNEVIDLGKKLSATRQKAAPGLCAEVEEILKQLAIPEARLTVDFEGSEPGANGTDQVTFRFSANKGVAAENLKKVASGGEFSRLMFAVKYIMAGKTALPTIIFDEIDTGVSGEIALRLGQLMKEMGSRHQILTITHLPQIAARGDVHYFVYKETGTEHTDSLIRRLEENDRIDEIAKMIAGDNPSSSAKESARELVNQ